MRDRNKEPWDVSQEEVFFFFFFKGHKEELWEVRQSKSGSDCCFKNIPTDKGGEPLEGYDMNQGMK